MIGLAGVNGHFMWSPDSFGRRCMNLVDSRGLVSVAQVIAALNGMPFNAAGWLQLRKIISELIAGSVAFPNDLTADGTSLAPGMSELIVGTRDVSSTIV